MRLSYKKIIQIGFLFPGLFLCSCATSTRGGAVGADRNQLLLIPSAQVDAASAQSYQKLLSDSKAKGVLNSNQAEYLRIKGIADRLIPQVKHFRSDALGWHWEANEITSPELNAFCMPGGKIAFYSGLVQKLKLTDAEIAAVMGHEIAHALREHGRERMSEEFIKTLGVEVLLATGQVEEKNRELLGQLSVVALTLPHSRSHELEADSMGLELMARAGYNPEEAITLWQKMAKMGGGKPPEFLSTHPSDSSRIDNIRSMLPKVRPFYLSAPQKK